MAEVYVRRTINRGVARRRNLYKEVHLIRTYGHGFGDYWERRVRVASAKGENRRRCLSPVETELGRSQARSREQILELSQICEEFLHIRLDEIDNVLLFFF